MALRNNAFSNFLLHLSKYIFPIVTFPYLTRVLSKEAIGSIFFVDSIVQYFIIIASIGIPLYGIREVSKLNQNKQLQANCVIELIVIQLIISIFLIIALASLPLVLHQLKPLKTLVYMGCISIFSSVFIIEWYFQGIEKYKYITIRHIIIKTINVACIFLFVKQAQDNTTYYLINNLFIALTALINIYFFITLTPNYNFKTLDIKKHFKPLLVMFSISASVAIYTIFDSIILGFLTNPETVSLYAIPLKIVQVFWTLVISISFVLIPKISQYYATNRNKKIEQLASSSLNVSLILTVPFFLFCILMPKEILFLVAGSKYENAYHVLQILSISPFIVAYCNILGSQYLLPIGKEKILLYATLLGLITSVVCNFIFIPYLSYKGTAIATLLAETTVFVFILIYTRRTLTLKLDKKLIFSIIATIVTSIIFWLVLRKYVSNYLLAIYVAAVYAVLFLLFDCFFIKSKYLIKLALYK